MNNTEAQYQPAGTSKQRGRSAVSAVMILIGLVLTPVAGLSVSAKELLSNTDTFVETFSPLADEPEFKAVLVDVALSAIGESIDSSSTAAWAKEQLDSLELSARLQIPLELLLSQVPGQLEEQLRTLLMRWIDSDQFRSVWDLMLRGAHGQMVAVFEQDPQALFITGADGVAELQIWPVIPTLLVQQNQRLTDFIAVIPEFTYTVAVGDGATLAQGTKMYSTINSAGTWLPWVSAALIILGIALAKRRTDALVCTSLAFAGLAAILALTLKIAPSVLISNQAQPPATPQFWDLTMDAVLQQTVTAAYLLGGAALLVAGITWGIGKLVKRD